VFGDFIIVSALLFFTIEYPVNAYSGLFVAIFSNLKASKAI